MLPAQPDTLWTRTYGGASTDIARCVQPTSDGGYILTGGTASYGAGDWNVYVIKTDSLGDTMWTRVYGGPYAAGSEWVECTADNGYIIAATIGYSDVWLIKIDAHGDTVWTSIFGGANGEGSWSVKQTQDGGYVVCGKTESYGAGLSDVWVIKTDAVGDSIWTRTYGGTNNDLGRSVVQTVDGGYVIAGYTYSYSAGQSDVWLIKTDSLGNPLWTKSYGGVDYDYAYQVVETQDHGYFITGMTQSFGNGGSDAWFIKTDSLGDTLWTKTFGDTSYEYMVSGVQTADGGYIACGYKMTNWIYDVWIIKLDSLGNRMWTKTLGYSDHDYGESIRQTPDLGYICAGYYYVPGTGISDIWLIRLAAETSIEEDDHGNTISNLRCDHFDINVVPNPFKNNLRIYYDIASDVGQNIYTPKWIPCSLKIYSASGCLVRQCDVKAIERSGCIVWSGTDQNNQPVPSGIYFVQLELNNHRRVKKVILIR